jgi:hypothetical protein
VRPIDFRSRGPCFLRSRARGRASTLALSVVLFLLAPAGRCLAAPDAEQEASVHFERGVEFYREGSLDAALVEFERSYDLTSNFRVLFNLAQVQAERHEYVAAIALFQKYLETGGAELTEARRKQAADEIALLEGRVAQLWVESNVEGAKLFVNDAPAGELPLAAAVTINPGVCNVRLEKPGYAPASKQLKVASGEQPRLHLALVSTTASAKAGAEEGEVKRAPFWISASSALALGGAALTFGLLARDANRDLDSELDRYPADENDIDAARKRLRTYAGLTDASAAAALVATGLAIYFAIAPPHRRAPARELSSRRGPSSLARPRARLDLSPAAGGLVLHGTF